MNRLSLPEFASRLDQNFFQISGQDDTNLLADTVFGRATEELRTWYPTLNERQRRNFFFVISRVGDLDNFLSLSKLLMIRPVLDRELDQMQTAAFAEAERLQRELIDAQRELVNLKAVNAALAASNDDLTGRLESAYVKIGELQVRETEDTEDAKRFRKIKELLA